MEIADKNFRKKKIKILDGLMKISHILLIQTIAAVTEGSIEDYEEGIQACSKAAKLWMKVRSSSLRFIAF